MDDSIDPSAPHGGNECSIPAMAGYLMLKPAQRKQFKADFDEVRTWSNVAIKFLEYFRLCFGRPELSTEKKVEAIAQAAFVMNKFSYHAVKCSQALYRIFAAQTFREEYRDWDCLCKDLGIHPATSHAIIGIAQVLEAPIKTPVEREREIPPELSVLTAYLAGLPQGKVKLNEGVMPAPVPTKRAKGPSSKPKTINMAKQFIMERLKDGAELRIGEVNEYSKKTLERAKKELINDGNRIETRRIGGSKGYSVWFISDSVAKTDGREAESP